MLGTTPLCDTARNQNDNLAGLTAVIRQHLVHSNVDLRGSVRAPDKPGVRARGVNGYSPLSKHSALTFISIRKYLWATMGMLKTPSAGQNVLKL